MGAHYKIAFKWDSFFFFFEFSNFYVVSERNLKNIRTCTVKKLREECVSVLVKARKIIKFQS